MQNRTPLIGATESLRELDWSELVAFRPKLLEQTLQELGFDEPAINRALDQQAEIEARLHVVDDEMVELRRMAGRFAIEPRQLRIMAAERESLLQRFWDMLKGISLHVESTTEQVVWVPLFVLSAPAVPGCSATFEASVMTGRALGWQITVVGGLTGARTMRTTTTWEVFADAGDVKKIMVPIDLTVERCAVMRRGQTVGHTYQSHAEVSHIYSTVPELVRDDEMPAIGDLAQVYKLSGDKPGAPYKKAKKYGENTSRSLAIEFEALGTKLGVTAEVEQDKNVVLSFQLVGGHDYVLHHISDLHGYLWGDIREAGDGASRRQVQQRSSRETRS